MPVLTCKVGPRYKSCLPPPAANSRGRLFPERGNMVTQPGGQEKPQLCSFRKISKPLMEKKRRARINVSLEQLKALLEKHYSHHIRKRRLEKADILELSVKYMKSLQNSVQGKTSVALPSPCGSRRAHGGCRWVEGSCVNLDRSSRLRGPAGYIPMMRIHETFPAGRTGGFHGKEHFGLSLSLNHLMKQAGGD
nr:transcription factor HES-3 [Chrysemys picta bellii]